MYIRRYTVLVVLDIKTSVRLGLRKDKYYFHKLLHFGPKNCVYIGARRYIRGKGVVCL